jgi:aspartyl protease family protein
MSGLNDVGARRLFWGVLIGLGLAALIIIARYEKGSIAGLPVDDFGALVVKIGLLVFLGGAVLALFRHQLSAVLEALLFWCLIGLLLAAGYTYRHDLRQVAERVFAELVPGRPVSRGNAVEIARTRAGDFQISAQINGNRIPTILDTGASSVVLTHEAAKAAGLPVEVLTFTVPVETANGRARAAAVTLDRLAIGNIVERSVPALVTQPGQLRVSLLGMSFLNRLESWEVRGDKLVLRGYP